MWLVEKEKEEKNKITLMCQDLLKREEELLAKQKEANSIIADGAASL